MTGNEFCTVPYMGARSGNPFIKTIKYPVCGVLRVPDLALSGRVKVTIVPNNA
jgi:hypothetical protein